MASQKISILDNFSSSVLQSSRQAMMFAIGFSLLPYLSFVAVIIIALVTLRHGMKSGFQILMAVLLPILALAAYDGMLIQGLIQATLSLAVTWLIAGLLRMSRSWSTVLTSVVAFSALWAVAVLVMDPGYIVDSKARLLRALMHWQKAGMIELDDKAILVSVDWLVEYLLGIQLAIVAFIMLSNLAFARFLQARIFNPGGFQQELLSLKLSKVNLFIFVLAIVGHLLFPGVFANTVLVISSLPLVLSGVSLMHWRVRRWGNSKWLLLIPAYFLMLGFPVLLLPLMAASCVDVWCDFRNFEPHVEAV